MKWIRLLLRGASASLLTAVMWVLWALGAVLTLPLSGARRRWRRWAFRRWARGLCRVLGVRVEVVGTPPAEPGVLVCNHLSYIDIPVLAGYLDTVFVSKSEVERWPVIGFLARCMGTIFIERDRKRHIPEVNRRIDAALAAGDGVVVFPEGTSTNGSSIAPFRGSLLAPAAEAQRPVQVASLSYRTPEGSPSASDSVCWWGDAPFVPHLLAFLTLERIDGRLEFGAAPVQDSDRKLLAEKLWRAVDQIFIPIA